MIQLRLNSEMYGTLKKALHAAERYELDFGAVQPTGSLEYLVATAQANAYHELLEFVKKNCTYMSDRKTL